MCHDKIELRDQNMTAITGFIVHNLTRPPSHCTSLFESITVFCGTDSLMWNIPHVQIEYSANRLEALVGGGSG